jgi:hypothetical protein
MIILDERNYLKDQLNSEGLEFYDFFQNSTVMNLKSFISLAPTKRSDIAFIDLETLLKHKDLIEEFKIVSNTFLGLFFFFNSKNQIEIDWLKNETYTSSKVLGVYSVPLDQFHSILLFNQLQFIGRLLDEQNMLQKQLTQFSQELDEVLRTAQEEMIKAKKIHENFIPKRHEDIKGIVFSNKYLVGEGAGAEFADLVQSQNKIYQILITSQSYLVTSCVMGILSQYKEGNFNPENFINDTLSEISYINKSKNRIVDFDLCVLEIDPASLQLTFLTDSKAECYSQMSGKIPLVKNNQYQLKKTEKVIVFSSGFIFNWSNKLQKNDLVNFLKTEKTTSLNELMSEIFFHLKEGMSEIFVRKDSTVIIMEANRHGIHKI